VTGIDASGGMLAVARRRTPAITWRQTPAEALPFADRAFDVVVSQFALMFFANPLAALREMRRVLAESGRVAVAVWNRIERAPAYAAEADLFERSAGRPAADAVRVPFALGDEQRLIQLFEDGGFSPIEIVSHTCVARFPSIRSMVEADLRGWLPVMDVHLDERVIRRVLDEAEPALREFVAADGTVVFDTNALIVRFALPPRTRQS
jgi:SAM-dependent methyltransferase